MTRGSRGFTLVELMLAMSFIAVLLISITMLIMHVTNQYTRGITLKNINSAGRVVSDDMQRTIQGSPPMRIQNNENFYNFASWGRLCLGTHTYVWNTGEGLAGDVEIPVWNRATAEGGEIRLVRVTDSGGALCVDQEPGEEGHVLPVVSLGDNAADMLGQGDRPLALHSINVRSTAPASATQQRLYSVNFTLGTDNTSVITGTGCSPPSEGAGSDLNYCAINDFDFTVRTGMR